MKTSILMTVSLLVGVVLGGLGVHGLHAQAKPPAYLVAANEVTDEDGFMKEYLPAARASIKEHGGRGLAGDKGVTLTGNLPTGRVAIVAFDSMDQLTTWWHSSEYQAAQKIGEKYAKFNQVAVNGQ